MKKEITFEKMEEENSDWEVINVFAYSARKIKALQKKAKQLCKDGMYQIHIVVLTGDDPFLQEFYYSDGTSHKAF